MLEQREQRIMKPKILFSLYLFLCCIKTINAEVYTALAEMEELLETEAVLISNLEGFIRVQQDKLDYLKTQSSKLCIPQQMYANFMLIEPLIDTLFNSIKE
uniref:Uncharacterized protein n=1 Tax=Glossina palpalis gambiensis TaxID=67801 RepID=A0A1B0BUS4_9MUSC